MDGDNGFVVLHGIATDWEEDLRSVVAVVLVRGRVQDCFSLSLYSE